MRFTFICSPSALPISPSHENESRSFCNIFCTITFCFFDSPSRSTSDIQLQFIFSICEQVSSECSLCACIFKLYTIYTRLHSFLTTFVSAKTVSLLFTSDCITSNGVTDLTICSVPNTVLLFSTTLCLLSL